jgi:hypothetical protein
MRTSTQINHQTKVIKKKQPFMNHQEGCQERERWSQWLAIMARSSDFQVNTAMNIDGPINAIQIHTHTQLVIHMLWLLDTLNSNRMKNNEDLNRSVSLSTVFIQSIPCTEGACVLGRKDEWYCWHLPVGCCAEFKPFTPLTAKIFRNGIQH